VLYLQRELYSPKRKAEKPPKADFLPSIYHDSIMAPLAVRAG
jgi:hypothetical protein